MNNGPIIVTFKRRRKQTLIVRTSGVRQVIIPFTPTLEGDCSLRVELRAAGAGVRIRGGGTLTGTQAVRLTVDTVHAAKRTTGSTVIKAVVEDSASFEFSGMIKIMKGANGSEDFLQQDSLLLSETAHANSVPALEIEADDVKASHAATVAPINQDQLFYLRSRGISYRDAEQLVARAFLARVHDVLSSTNVS